MTDLDVLAAARRRNAVGDALWHDRLDGDGGVNPHTCICGSRLPHRGAPHFPPSREHEWNPTFRPSIAAMRARPHMCDEANTRSCSPSCGCPR